MESVKQMTRSLLIEDAAVLLGVSRRTVYYRIRQGRLNTVRTICGSQRVLLTSIEELLRQGRQLRQAGSNAVTPAFGGGRDRAQAHSATGPGAGV